MRILQLTAHEIIRLLRTLRSWLFIAIYALTPVIFCTDMFGLGGRYFSGTMTTVLMLQPAQFALKVSAFAAALHTLLEMQRDRRAHCDTLIESVVTPAGYAVRKVLALLVVMVLSAAAAAAALLPYTALMMGGLFRLNTFLRVWGPVYCGGLVITMIATAGVYMITRSLEAGFVLMASLIALDITRQYNSDFRLPWLSTQVNSISDISGSISQIRMIAYSRLLWLTFSLALFFLGLNSLRRYGLNWLRSFLQNVRRAALPLLMAAMAAAGILLFTQQPFIDNGPMLTYEEHIDPETGQITMQDNSESMSAKADYNAQIYASKGKADIFIGEDRLEGQAEFELRCTSSKEQDMALLLAPGLEIREALLDGQPVALTREKDDSFMASVWHVKLKGPLTGQTLSLHYAGAPRNRRDFQQITYMITPKFVFLDRFLPELYSGNNVLPVECTVTMSDTLTPFVTGQIIYELAPLRKGCKTYRFSTPVWRWLIAGDYNVEKFNVGGLDVQFVYFREKAGLMRESMAADTLRDVIEYFTRRFGPLDFNGMPLVLLELDGSIAAGWAMENISMFGETMFMNGAYKAAPGSANVEGGSGLGLAVHEIAHQWWGFGPSSVYTAEDGISPWSGEGLTCYSSYLYMKERFGKEYALSEYADLWQRNAHRLQNAFYMVDRENYARLAEPDALRVHYMYAGLTRYDLMPALLLKAESLTGGEDAFVARLSKMYMERHGDFTKPLDYETFLQELGLTKGVMTLDE